MPKFLVSVSQCVKTTTDCVIEAEDSDEAAEKSLAIVRRNATAGQLHWKSEHKELFVAGVAPAEAVSVRMPEAAYG